ncbi:MAG: YicC family protein [Chlamydiales bacterium 38-26]|nr:YicC family protein [Chlamydiales bacterium]OJV09229.1 MAG: YicC family protein [Chlamydiales bacterium 38-26]
MLKSMTAYGRSSQETSLGHFTAEIQSVNRKFLEINVFLPRELSRFDSEVKKWVSAQVDRGQITIKFSAVFSKGTPVSVLANIPLALQIQQAAHHLTKALGIADKDELTLRLLAKEPSVLLFNEQMEDEALYLESLRNVFEGALEQFLEMKTQEGRAVYIDIAHRLEFLEKEIQQIAFYAPQATKRYRDRLSERLKEFTLGSTENEERILKEIGIYAERIDISEEITLFEAHLKQFSETLLSKNASVAKTLEFIIQEMNREVNTIGSKSSEIEVSRRVVEMKSAIEKIREIIQNVE